MSIPLKKQHADWIAEQVRAGRYASELEAIEDALAARIEEDEDVRRLREKLVRAEEDIAAGRLTLADDAFFKRLHDRIDSFSADEQN